ncbi:MAG: ParB/RepB/Spo0J family partition protein [Bacteroidetes bacterium]|nr:ParB/RepB/Spo0J family partition protein [Bacteroidota bacterium]MBU1720651.1 ParB/RepB/Spo0J family partition protein [Bacteroidota bacterium]
MSTPKKALGKGLGALLADIDTHTISQRNNPVGFQTGNIAEVSINDISANPFQPRTIFEEQALNELADSIRTLGIIQPITVRRTDGNKFQLISGERRFQASRIAGLKHIPAYIRVAQDDEMLQLALVENIQRENLNAMEIAISYNRLVEECRMTQDDISHSVGKDRSTVANYIRLLKLPAAIQLAIKENEITMGHARALISVAEPEMQLRIFNQIVSKGLNVRKSEELVRDTTASTTYSAKKKVFTKKYSGPAKEISKFLNAKTEIKAGNKGKGQIVIAFNSEEELKKIISTLTKN